MLHSWSSMSSGFSPFPGMLLKEARWRGARSPPHTTMQNAKHPQCRKEDAALSKKVGLGPPRQHKTWISSVLCSVSTTFREIPVPGREQKSLCVQIPNGSDVQTTNWVAWPHQNCCKSEDMQNYCWGYQRAQTPKLECQKGKDFRLIDQEEGLKSLLRCCLLY